MQTCALQGFQSENSKTYFNRFSLVPFLLFRSSIEPHLSNSFNSVQQIRFLAPLNLIVECRWTQLDGSGCTLKTDNNSWYWFSRSRETVVLGGSHVDGDWNTDVCKETKARIFRGCCKILPSLRVSHFYHNTVILPSLRLKPSKKYYKCTEVSIQLKQLNLSKILKIHKITWCLYNLSMRNLYKTASDFDLEEKKSESNPRLCSLRETGKFKNKRSCVSLNREMESGGEEASALGDGSFGVLR